MWLSSADHNFQLVEACLGLQKFSEYHRTNLTASEDPNFEWATFLSEFESRLLA